MGRFLYQARDAQGQSLNGVIAADNPQTAAAMLRQQGQYVVKLRQVRDHDQTETPTAKKSSASGVRRQDVVFFCHQLAVMLETGVPISEALACIVEQTGNPAFKRVTQEIADHVQAGGELSTALKYHDGLFPSIMISLIRASEVSGTMGSMLQRVSSYLEKEERTRRQIRGALSYPIFMLVFAMLVTLALTLFVLPKFTQIYASRQAILPTPTRWLLAFSDSVTQQWPLWISVLVFAGAAMMLFFQSMAGRRCLDWLKLSTPILRHLYMQMYLSRASRTLGTMLTSGVAMLDAVEITRSVTPNVYFQQLWDKVDLALKQGLQLSDPLFESTLIPRSVTQMIRSGEKSGRLSQVMGRIAEHTENEFDVAVQTTTKFIEPVLVVTMGMLVGGVAIALLLPIFNISKVVTSG